MILGLTIAAGFMCIATVVLYFVTLRFLYSHRQLEGIKINKYKVIVMLGLYPVRSGPPLFCREWSSTILSGVVLHCSVRSGPPLFCTVIYSLMSTCCAIFEKHIYYDFCSNNKTNRFIHSLSFRA